MKHVILNKMALENYQKGYADNFPPIFYHYSYLDDNGHLRHSWTRCMGEAKQFADEEAAWSYLKAHWGLKFTYHAFGVLSVHHEALEASLKSKEKIVHGKEAT